VSNTASNDVAIEVASKLSHSEYISKPSLVSGRAQAVVRNQTPFEKDISLKIRTSLKQNKQIVFQKIL